LGGAKQVSATFDKVKKNGKVAVLYSPDYGAGWSSWSGGTQKSQLCMDARLVNAFIQGGDEAAARMAESLFPDFYTGGSEGLTVKWIPEGTAFRIEEYDGSESIVLLDESNYFVA
jgi:hypothetical protein